MNVAKALTTIVLLFVFLGRRPVALMRVSSTPA